MRLNRAVELTAAGALLARDLHAIFARLDDLLDPRQHQQRSTIIVSVLPSLAAKWLAPRLPDFEERYPQWQVRLEVGDELIDFTSGTVDLALRYGPGKYPGLHARRWMPAKVFPVCSPALLEQKPLDKPADLRGHTLIHSDSGSLRIKPPGWLDWLRAAAVDKVNAQRGPAFTNTYMALEAAVAGHGVALAPAPMVARDLASGRLVKPLALELDNPFSFWIVCPRQHLQDEKVKTLTAWLIQQAKASSA